MMILIAESGSTKTEWVILADQKIQETIYTSGFNPFYQGAEDIELQLQLEYSSVQNKFDAIYFYGAGCINEEKQEIVKTALCRFFSSEYIKTETDLLGAARSLCQDQAGIVCILGTGSNSCYYNGAEIANHVSPLGFILGDEGSGAALGKKLIGDVLKKQLPQHLIDDFFETYRTTPSEILENVYRQPFPNRYLAGFTKFLFKNIAEPGIEQIVIMGFREFVTRNLLQYPGIYQTPVHFAGSIAFHFKEQLLRVIKDQNLHLGNIAQSPMKGLISYHLK